MYIIQCNICGFQPFVWNEVALVFDGTNMVASVNDIFEDVFVDGKNLRIVVLLT